MRYSPPHKKLAGPTFVILSQPNMKRMFASLFEGKRPHTQIIISPQWPSHTTGTRMERPPNWRGPPFYFWFCTLRHASIDRKPPSTTVQAFADHPLRMKAAAVFTAEKARHHDLQSTRRWRYQLCLRCHRQCSLHKLHRVRDLLCTPPTMAYCSLLPIVLSFSPLVKCRQQYLRPWAGPPRFQNLRKSWL